MRVTTFAILCFLGTPLFGQGFGAQVDVSVGASVGTFNGSVPPQTFSQTIYLPQVGLPTQSFTIPNFTLVLPGVGSASGGLNGAASLGNLGLNFAAVDSADPTVGSADTTTDGTIDWFDTFTITSSSNLQAGDSVQVVLTSEFDSSILGSLIVDPAGFQNHI